MNLRSLLSGLASGLVTMLALMVGVGAFGRLLDGGSLAVIVLIAVAAGLLTAQRWPTGKG